MCDPSSSRWGSISIQCCRCWREWSRRTPHHHSTARRGVAGWFLRSVVHARTLCLSRGGRRGGSLLHLVIPILLFVSALLCGCLLFFAAVLFCRLFSSRFVWRPSNPQPTSAVFGDVTWIWIWRSFFNVFLYFVLTRWNEYVKYTLFCLVSCFFFFFSGWWWWGLSWPGSRLSTPSTYTVRITHIRYTYIMIR